MTYPIVRVTDSNSAGGMAVSARLSVLSGTMPLAGFMSPVTPHPCCGAPGCSIHCAATILPSVSTVLAGGLPVHKVMDVDTCGHTRVTGDSTVLVFK